MFEVYDALSLTDDGPGFLQLMALGSFHAFIQEGVEVAIYETHHGGEFCATNVAENPVVTAITNIGIDHIIDLGPTLENIAWHKAGILKQGVPALTVSQDPEVLTVLEKRAAKKDVQMRIVDINRSLPKVFPSDAMRLNCSLALAVTNAFLQRVASSDQSKSLSEEEMVQGFQQFYWPGRFEQIPGQCCTWFLDEAHNELSVVEAARWFQQISQGRYAMSSLPQSQLTMSQMSSIHKAGADVRPNLRKARRLGHSGKACRRASNTNALGDIHYVSDGRYRLITS